MSLAVQPGEMEKLSEIYKDSRCIYASGKDRRGKKEIMFIFEREREIEHGQGRGRERETQNLKQAPGSRL